MQLVYILGFMMKTIPHVTIAEGCPKGAPSADTHADTVRRFWHQTKSCTSAKPDGIIKQKTLRVSVWVQCAVESSTTLYTKGTRKDEGTGGYRPTLRLRCTSPRPFNHTSNTREHIDPPRPPLALLLLSARVRILSLSRR